MEKEIWDNFDLYESCLPYLPTSKIFPNGHGVYSPADEITFIAILCPTYNLSAERRSE